MLRHCLIWLLLIVVLPIMAPVMFTPNNIQTFIRTDYAQAVSMIGNAKEIDGIIVNFYRNALSSIDSMVTNFSNGAHDAEEHRRSGDPLRIAISGIPARWSDTVKLQAYSLALRLAVLCLWLPWLILPGVFCVVAGILERKLKLLTFNPPRPPVYNTAAHAIMALLFFTVLWVLSPIPLPVLAIPILTTLLTYFVFLAVANYPI